MDSRMQSNSASSVFATVKNEKCFRIFDSKFAEGPGNARVSFALAEIRGWKHSALFIF